MGRNPQFQEPRGGRVHFCEDQMAECPHSLCRPPIAHQPGLMAPGCLFATGNSSSHHAAVERESYAFCF